jgi:hypothetical protein
MSRDLFIDLSIRRIVVSDTEPSPIGSVNFTKGDSGEIRLYFLRPTPTGLRPFELVDKSDATVKFGIGQRSAVPSAGEYTLTFGGDTTAAIVATATAELVQTRLNALASITTAGGVTVTGSVGTKFTVRFNTVGVRDNITGDVTQLTPDSTISVAERIAGTASVREVQEIQIRINPVVFQSTWTDLPTAITATVETTVTGDSLNGAVQRLSFSNAPFFGSYRLTYPSVDFGSTVSGQSFAITSGVITTPENHGLILDQPIKVVGLVDGAVTGLSIGTFFVKSVPEPTQFTVAVTAGGTLITSSGTGIQVETISRQTTGISANATSEAVEAALQSLDSIGSGNIVVTGIQGEYFDIAFAGEKNYSDQPLLTIQNGTTAKPGKTADVNFLTFALRDLLADRASIDLDLELEVSEDGGRQTVILQPCSIAEELILEGSFSPALGFSVVPIDAGGTGATSAAAAVTALGLPAAANIATLSGAQTITGVKTFTGNAFPVVIYNRAVVGASAGLAGTFALQLTSTGAANDGGGPIFAARIQGDGMANPSTIAQIGFARAGANNTGEVIIQPLNAGAAVNALVAKPSGNIVVRGSIEIEGTTISANKAILSAQDPTGTRTYRLANAPTTATLDVVAALTKTDTGDPASGYEGQMVINTLDNTLKVYADAGWRQIATW